MSETIDLVYKSLQINVTYNHQPEEAATNDYPGAAESFEIEEVESEGVDLTQFCEQLDLFEELEEEIRTKLN